MMDRVEGHFIVFTNQGHKPGRSTDVWNINSKKTGELEGTIRWHGRRGYSLAAGPNTVFGPVCLTDTLNLIRKLNSDHKAARIVHA